MGLAAGGESWWYPFKLWGVPVSLRRPHGRPDAGLTISLPYHGVSVRIRGFLAVRLLSKGRKAHTAPAPMYLLGEGTPPNPSSPVPTSYPSEQGEA